MKSCDQSTLPECLVEREELPPRAHDEEPVADDERRGVRSGAFGVVDARGGRRVPVLPDRLAGGGIERRDHFFLREAAAGGRGGPVHRIQAAAFREHHGMALAERAATTAAWDRLRASVAARPVDGDMKSRVGPPHWVHEGAAV